MRMAPLAAHAHVHVSHAVYCPGYGNSTAPRQSLHSSNPCLPNGINRWRRHAALAPATPDRCCNTSHTLQQLRCNTRGTWLMACCIIAGFACTERIIS